MGAMNTVRALSPEDGEVERSNSIAAVRSFRACLRHDGIVVGLLDWEQAAIGPAELDIGFWLSSRRQAREAVRVMVDPELAGFPTRDEVLTRFEAGLGRPLRAIEWHEAFAMVRMGTCIVSTQALLRRAGQTDHPFINSAPLPDWTTAVISGATKEAT